MSKKILHNLTKELDNYEYGHIFYIEKLTSKPIKIGDSHSSGFIHGYKHYNLDINRQEKRSQFGSNVFAYLFHVFFSLLLITMLDLYLLLLDIRMHDNIN